MTGVNPPNMLNGLQRMAPQLFNLDTTKESEKPLDLKLNLYQMETIL
jgi:hypothetical protein